MNPVGSLRAQTMLIVSLSPGIHLRKLQKLLGASFTTTRYHVDNLERDGEIVRAKDGRYDRLYPIGTSERMKRVYAVLQSKTARKILTTMEEAGGAATVTYLAARVDVSRSSLSEYFALLSGADLLRRSLDVDGRAVYLVRDSEEVKLLLAAFQRNLMSIATGNFIDLWDL